MKQLNEQQITVLRTLLSGQKEIISIATRLDGNGDNKYELTQGVLTQLVTNGLIKHTGAKTVAMFELTEKGVEVIRNYREKK